MSEPACRLNQRDDSQGVAAHARINVPGDSPNRATSTQEQHAPRVGETNRYS